MEIYSITPILLIFNFFIMFCGPVVAQHKCRGAFDMYFVLDKSSSVTTQVFKTKVVPFVSNVVSNFVSEKMRLSFIVFSTKAEVILKLTADKKETSNGLERLRLLKTEGGTHLELGLEKVNEQIVKFGHDTASIVLVLTDGRFQHPAYAYKQANKARENGATIVVIGVGPVLLYQLNRVANKPSSKFVYIKHDFSEIESVITDLVNQSCVEILSASVSQVCVLEPFNVTLQGTGFDKTNDIKKVNCSYKFNSTYRIDTKPFHVSSEKIECPGFIGNSPSSYVVEVTLNGKSYVSSSFTILIKRHCVYMSGARPEHVCTSPDPFEVSIVGDGFTKIRNLSNAHCEMTWNSSFVERVEAVEIQNSSLVCPVRAMPEPRFVAIRVSLDGTEFIYGSANVTSGHCVKQQEKDDSVLTTGCSSTGICLPRSCQEIKERYPKAVSGVYFIRSEKLRVYCEMAINRGGYTFLQRRDIHQNNHIVDDLFKDKSSVLLRFQNPNGLQPFTVIKQLPKFSKIPLSVKQNNYTGYIRPINYGLGAFIYLGLLPKNIASAIKNPVQGFQSNGRSISFTNCDRNPNSYFAFFPNHKEQNPSAYHSNLLYEKVGVAIEWRKTGKRMPSSRTMPREFFLFTEIHFGGCGAFTSSDRWLGSVEPALDTAIGVR